MSMLSAQCDELREVATRYDELQVGAVKAVTMPSNMGSILREAADTIWELRCKLSDMVDERERARVAEAENAKLRELLLDTLMHPREYCEKHGIEYAGWDSANTHINARMRDLGIEVS